MSLRLCLIGFPQKTQARCIKRCFVSNSVQNNSLLAKGQKEESEKMKKFREKLKSSSWSRRVPVLVDTNPKSGELLNDDADPTKWGDWQNGGRVSDF